MTRVLLFGFGALPIEKLRVAGPSLRTWHFTRAILDAGHEVCLIGDRMAGIYPEDLPPRVSQRLDRLTYHSVDDTLWHNPRALRPLIADFKPDCAIAVTTPACGVAVANCGNLPLWCDMYGSIMAEAQLKALIYGSDSHLIHFWNMERVALERGDVFSTVSERQQWSLIGELGLWGRLNQWTSSHTFAHTIPIASEIAPYQVERRALRGVLVPEDAFIILYSGGYNTWTDVDTLFAALEQVMRLHPNAYFVSTGGAITGHDDFTFRRFEHLIQASERHERYKLCGWIPASDVPCFYLESDLAINTDRFAYETVLGSRTRILDWLRAGLPCISSNLTELAQTVANAGAGLTYPPGDADALAAAILRLRDADLRREMASNGRKLLESQFTYAQTAAPLLAWLQHPHRAPDYQHRTQLAKPYWTVSAEVWQMIKTRRLNLSLAVQAWKPISRITDALGLGFIQRRLARIGQRALKLAESPYRAAWGKISAPKTVTCREPFEIQVSVQNVGSVTWFPSSDTPHGMAISARWLTASGQIASAPEVMVTLPHSVPPKQRILLTLRVAAPAQVGNYLLEADLVRIGVTRFGQYGVQPPKVAIEVV